MALQVHKSGRVDIYVATAAAPDTLLLLGDATDSISIAEQAFYMNVPGDRNGGRGGPPIEVQDLGSIFAISFSLSRWDDAVVDLIRQRARDTKGSVKQVDVGRLLLLENSFRLCLHCPDDPTPPAYTYSRNFPCCLARTPVSYNMGTKFQEMRFQFEAHRAPAGHASVDVIVDDVVTGVPV